MAHPHERDIFHMNERSLYRQLESYVKTSRRVFFGIFHVMLKEADVSASSFYISMVIGFLQMLAFPLNPRFGFWGGGDLAAALHDFTSFFQAGTWVGGLSDAWALALLRAVYTMTFLCTANAVYVGYCYSKDDFFILWPVRSLRAIVRFMSTVLAIPFMSITMLVWSKCEGDNAASCASIPASPVDKALASLALVVFGPLIFFGRMVFFAQSPASTSSGGVAQSREVFFMLVSQFAFIVVFALFPSHSFHGVDTYVGLLVFSILLLGSVEQLLRLPYYDLEANKVNMGFQFVTMWAALVGLCNLSARFDKNDKNNGPGIAFVVGSPLFFFLGYKLCGLYAKFFYTSRKHRQERARCAWACIQRLRRVADFDDDEEDSDREDNEIPAERGAPSQQDEDEKTMWLPSDVYVELNVRFLQRNKSSGKKSENKERREQARVREAKVVYEEGLQRFPRSAGVLISYARYLMDWEHNAMAGWQLLEKLGKWPEDKLSLSDRFFIFHFQEERKRAEASQFAAGSQSKLDVVRVIEMQNNLKTANAQYLSTVRLLNKFWSTLLLPEISVGTLEEVLDSISRAKSNCAESFAALLQNYPNSPAILRAHARFLEVVQSDHEGAERSLTRADDEEDQRATEHRKKMPTADSPFNVGGKVKERNGRSVKFSGKEEVKSDYPEPKGLLPEADLAHQRETSIASEVPFSPPAVVPIYEKTTSPADSNSPRDVEIKLTGSHAASEASSQGKSSTKSGQSLLSNVRHKLAVQNRKVDNSGSLNVLRKVIYLVTFIFLLEVVVNFVFSSALIGRVQQSGQATANSDALNLLVATSAGSVQKLEYYFRYNLSDVNTPAYPRCLPTLPRDPQGVKQRTSANYPMPWSCSYPWVDGGTQLYGNEKNRNDTSAILKSRALEISETVVGQASSTRSACGAGQGADAFAVHRHIGYIEVMNGDASHVSTDASKRLGSYYVTVDRIHPTTGLITPEAMNFQTVLGRTASSLRELAELSSSEPSARAWTKSVDSFAASGGNNTRPHSLFGNPAYHFAFYVARNEFVKTMDFFQSVLSEDSTADSQDLRMMTISTLGISLLLVMCLGWFTLRNSVGLIATEKRSLHSNFLQVPRHVVHNLVSLYKKAETELEQIENGSEALSEEVGHELLAPVAHQGHDALVPKHNTKAKAKRHEKRRVVDWSSSSSYSLTHTRYSLGLAAFIVLQIIACVTILSADTALDRGAAQLVASGRRTFLLKQIQLDVMDIVTHSHMSTKYEAKAAVQERMAFLSRLHGGLLFGDESLGLDGVYLSDAEQDAVNFGDLCSRADVAAMCAANPTTARLSANGMNTLVDEFLVAAHEVITSTDVPGDFRSPSVALVEEIGDGILPQIGALITDLYETTTERILSSAKLDSRTVMIVAVCLILSIHLVVFAPMVDLLRQEGRHSREMMLGLPLRALVEMPLVLSVLGIDSIRLFQKIATVKKLPPEETQSPISEAESESEDKSDEKEDDDVNVLDDASGELTIDSDAGHHRCGHCRLLGYCGGHEYAALALFAVLMFLLWGVFYMADLDLMNSLEEYAHVMGFTALGSFFVAVVPMGGGSVASPPMILLFGWDYIVIDRMVKLVEVVALGAAFLYIVLTGIKIDWKSYSYVVPGAAAGQLLGFVSAKGVPLFLGKVVFAALQFGMLIGTAFVLFSRKQRQQKETPISKIPIQTAGDIAELVFVGALGGGLNQLVGLGVGLMFFFFAVVYHNMHERLAVSTAIAMMFPGSLISVLTHLDGMSGMAMDLFISNGPLALIFAPIGVLLNDRTNDTIRRFLWSSAVIAQVAYLPVFARGLTHYLMGGIITAVFAVVIPLVGVGGDSHRTTAQFNKDIQKLSNRRA